MDQIVSVILAGGEGTRLYPLTRCRCKPDVRFAGRYRLIDIPISNSINSKIQNIFILSQHYTTSLHQHILSTYPPTHFQSHKINLLTPKEVTGKKNLFKGTADAVRQNLDRILSSTAEYVLILAGDQLYHMNYHEMINFAKKEDADLVIAALPVEEQEAKRMGLLKIDPLSHVIDFFEKPPDRKTLDMFALAPKPDHEQQYLGSMGIYIFKKEALLNLLNQEGDDFGKHVIPNQVKKGKTSAFIYNGYWEDIGTISAYYQANLALTNDQNWMQSYNETNQLYTPHNNMTTPLIKATAITNSLINQGALIEAKEVTHSIVGLKTWIKEHTIVRDCIIIGENCPTHSVVIGKNCILQKAIIDSDVIIGDNVHLINQKNVQKFDSEYVFIREGIIIVTSGARLPDGFVL
jgi:glucose-1-phosphate adenylyltransferase